MTGTFGTLLLERVIHLGLVNPAEVEGCTLDELSELMVDQSVKRLPEIYRQFLLVMGRYTGGLFAGTTITMPEVLELKDDLMGFIEMNFDARLNIPALANEKVDMLPDDAFVFYTHQAYDYGYFLTDNTEGDPPVYVSLEGWGNHERKWASLSQFFENRIQEWLAYKASRENNTLQ